MDVAFGYWTLDMTIWMACRLGQFLSRVLEATDVLLHSRMASLIRRDWVRTCSLYGEESGKVLFCFLLKIHDTGEEGFLLWSSSLSWLLFSWWSILSWAWYKREVRHNGASSCVQQGRCFLTDQTSSWVSFHRKLADSYISWSWLNGREIMKVMTVIKSQPSGDCNM